jgi:hypothetical protein
MAHGNPQAHAPDETRTPPFGIVFPLLFLHRHHPDHRYAGSVHLDTDSVLLGVTGLRAL